MPESEIKPGRIRWRWGIGIAVSMTLIALFPQIHFAFYRGHQWNCANAIMHPDEVAYSAYAASLIRGNPRRYDPYTGRGGQNDAPESLFSIQMLPAYAVALPARWLRLSASTVFMILPGLCAFAASLALFWFIWLLTRDDLFSAASAALILSLGTLMAGQGIARHVLNLPYLVPIWISNHVAPTSLYHLPFLRLYQPAVAFPLFFLFCGLVWLALTRMDQWRTVVLAGCAGATFVLLVFSYFYLWTTAAVWLGLVCALWLILGVSERKQTIVVFVLLLIPGIAALVPYLALLSHRASTVDTAQALVFTHRPDLFRLPEFVALLTLIVIGVSTRRDALRRRQPTVLVASAFALTVLAVFNQQVVTGRSLQPIHYQWFIGSYCALTALVLTAALWRSGTRLRLTNQKLAVLTAVALLWAFGEVSLAATVSFDYNRAIDEGKPVADRLAQLAGTSGNVSVVLVADLKLADRLPTDASHAVLWSPRMLIFPGVSEAENRERFWQRLYYLGYDEKKFWAELNHGDWNFLAGLFPYDRLSPAVRGNQSPIMPEELREQLTRYLDYASKFNRERATSPSLSYLIVQADNEPNYTNLDRWYQRDNEETIGGSILYRLRLR